MKIETKTLSVAECSAILERKNQHNRTISDDIVQRYAQMMEAGAWDYQNGTTIVFGMDGNLLDGQHRLAAAVRSNIPYTTIVVHTRSDTAFATIDQHRLRSLASVVRLSGFTSIEDHCLAAGFRWCVLMREGRMRSVSNGSASNNVAEVVSALPTMQNVVSVFERTKGLRWFGGPMIGCAAHLWDYQPDKAIRFVDGIVTGADLNQGDPRLVLRNRVLADKPLRRNPNELVSIMVKAWNAWFEGRKIGILKADRRATDGRIIFPKQIAGIPTRPKAEDED